MLVLSILKDIIYIINELKDFNEEMMISFKFVISILYYKFFEEVFLFCDIFGRIFKVVMIS